MAELHDIDEGYTQDFLIHGIGVLAVGGILSLVHWSLSVVMLVLAIAFFRVRSGIEIDVDGKRARVYKAIGTFKWGAWVDTTPFERIELRYTNESQVMNSRAASTNVRVRTYDLVFKAPTHERLFHDFTDHATARKATAIMVKGWSFAFEDQVELIKQRARENAVHRRR